MKNPVIVITTCIIGMLVGGLEHESYRRIQLGISSVCHYILHP